MKMAWAVRNVGYKRALAGTGSPASHLCMPCASLDTGVQVSLTQSAPSARAMARSSLPPTHLQTVITPVRGPCDVSREALLHPPTALCALHVCTRQHSIRW
jgi:hypothetical protein